MDTDFLDQIQTFLPTYLSPEKKEDLYRELSQFPDNFNYYFSGQKYETDLLQGDCWPGLVVCSPDTHDTKVVKGVILSNSCDIDVANSTARRKKVVYCPLIRLSSYRQLLSNAKSEEAVESTLSDIRKQRVTYLFYLPECGDMEESVIVLDDVHSMLVDHIDREGNDKIFTLSQYGFYMFLVKLSIHFTRFQEGIVRFDEEPATA